MRKTFFAVAATVALLFGFAGTATAWSPDQAAVNRYGTTVYVSGTAGADTISVHVTEEDRVRVEASEGLLVGYGGCQRLSAIAADCGPAEGVTTRIGLGDGDDTLDVENGLKDTVDAGAGVDSVKRDQGDTVVNAET
ncbi:hypothetical protein GCM10012275_28040 [Longimycelium tulufanense]|uniref:Uncharacterized protein n=1 Tax=Longimycelium tulufanense TaxID=907463 RepID=A0A8J3FU48_9PSEU|nr:hypothetical protein [Longimycelium tulufanense]GGM55285.1 hypothetical protein GCM10012275_28040 [Longimycelium tulufanense]